jgi:G3E family GTPase
MLLLALTGFLGSGKTTFAVKLVKAALKKDLKVAVIVNEIGEVGIDDQFMKRLGFNVWEILGGCICCTLTANLVQTLEELHAAYSPDLVIVEPSGAADPRGIFSVFAHARISSLSRRRQIAILDPLRMEMLIAVIEPLVTSTIEQADLILISKADLASVEQIEHTRRIAEGINSSAQIAVSGAGEDAEILSEILSWLI